MAAMGRAPDQASRQQATRTNKRWWMPPCRPAPVSGGLERLNPARLKISAYDQSEDRGSKMAIPGFGFFQFQCASPGKRSEITPDGSLTSAFACHPQAAARWSRATCASIQRYVDSIHHAGPAMASIRAAPRSACCRNCGHARRWARHVIDSELLACNSMIIGANWLMLTIFSEPMFRASVTSERINRRVPSTHSSM